MNPLQYIYTNLIKNQNFICCIQVMQLVGNQDTGFFLQKTTDTPDIEIALCSLPELQCRCTKFSFYKKLYIWEKNRKMQWDETKTSGTIRKNSNPEVTHCSKMCLPTSASTALKGSSRR